MGPNDVHCREVEVGHRQEEGDLEHRSGQLRVECKLCIKDAD